MVPVRTAVLAMIATALPHAQAGPVFGKATLDVYGPDNGVVRFCATASVDDPVSLGGDTVFLVAGNANPPVVEYDFPGDTYLGPSCIDVDTGGATAGAVNASITLLAYGTSDFIARCEQEVAWWPGQPPINVTGYCV